MATKKNEPAQQPAAATAGAANQPTQSLPAAAAESSSIEAGVRQSTPFDSVNAQESATGVKDAFGAGTWHNNKKVNALWSKAETRNAWIGITDLGWKKISPASDSSVTAICMVAASALETQSPVNVLLDNDQVVEIYNW